jgi:hypothetical protein
LLLRRIVGLGVGRAAAHGASMGIWRVDVASGKVDQLSALVDEPRAAWANHGGMYVLATNSLYEVAPHGTTASVVGPSQFNGDIDIAPQR